MTITNTEFYDSSREALIEERTCISLQEAEGIRSASESHAIGQRTCMTSVEDPGDEKQCTSRKINSVTAFDKAYRSFSEEYKNKKTSTKQTEYNAINPSQNRNTLKNKIITKSGHPPNIQTLFDGFLVGLPDDYKVPVDNKPSWLDMKKFKKGQQFSRDHYFGLSSSELMTLMFTLSVPDEIQPIIFNGQAVTPFKSFRRFLSTALKVTSWIDDDVWSKESIGYKNLRTVRAMHLNVSKRINSVPHSELKEKLTVEGVWSTLKPTLSEDFRSACPFQQVFADSKGEDLRIGEIYFSQGSMGITQFAFISFMVVYPDKFGAADATEEELEGFIHLWRGLGYLLGIEDKYNFCNGSVQEVRERCVYMIEKVIKPYFLSVTEDWEHMSRCLVEGGSYYISGLNFESSLLYLCWILDVPVPRTTASVSWMQYFEFQLTKIIFCFVMRLPGARPFFNGLLRKSLAKASSWSTEFLDKLQSKTYDYEKQTRFID